MVVQPVGFLSDHMEVLFDLDEEAALLAQRPRDGRSVRAGTAGTDPQFVGMFAEPDPGADSVVGLIAPLSAEYPASHDVCPPNCCLLTPRLGPPDSATADSRQPALGRHAR